MKKSQFTNRSIGAIGLAIIAAALTAGTARAQYTAVWYDGYDTSAASLDINFEYNTRQGGTPVQYVANVGSQATDYHQQVLGTPGPLLLAGDSFIGTFSANPLLNTIGYTTVSPNANFKGTTGGGEIIGKRITFALDVFGAANTYSSAAITIGGNSTLEGGRQAGAASGLTIRFLEDTAFGAGNLIQLYDGGSFLANFTNPGGANWLDVRLDINDPNDGNPWDGIGWTSTDIYVNNAFVVNFTKIGGGYANDFITLEGTADFVDFSLTTHYFDNLTVYASPVPEPSTFALAALGMAGLFIFRRRK